MFAVDLLSRNTLLGDIVLGLEQQQASCVS